jgi:hypothetical protein
MITLLPAFLCFIWMTDRTILLNRKVMITVVLLVLAGALQYSYLIWRFYAAPDQSYLELQTPNLHRFLFAVTGASFKEKMFAFSMQQVLLERLPMYANLVWLEYSVLILLAVYGWFQIKDRGVKTFLFLAFTGNLFYALNYDIPDISLYFIPGYLVLVICIACAFGTIRILRRAVAGIMILSIFPLILLFLNYRQVDQSANTEDAEQARIIFNSLENNAVMITNYDFSQYLWYSMFEENPQHKWIHIFRTVPPNLPEFLAGNGTLFVRESRQRVPVGASVYTTGAEHRLKLLKQGLRLVRTEQRHVLRVLPR